MNIRRVQTHTEGSHIYLRMEVGHGTVPTTHRFEIDPATALVLMGQLEHAVHAACPDGVTPSEAPLAHAALVAASASKPIAVAVDEDFQTNEPQQTNE